MTDQLKPCPNPFPGDDETEHNLFMFQIIGGRCRAECACGITGPIRTTELDAIAAWNTRAAPFGWTEDELRAIEWELAPMGGMSDEISDWAADNERKMSELLRSFLAKLRKGKG